MKRAIFGIALLLFALVLLMAGRLLPLVGDLMSREELAVLVGLVGVVIAGWGAFSKDE